MTQEQRIFDYLKAHADRSFTTEEIQAALYATESVPITSTRRNLCALRDKEMITRSRYRENNAQGPYTWRFRKKIQWL